MVIKRLLIISLLLLSIPTSAQELDTVRDPWSLAQRLLKFEGDYAIPPLTPRYEPGDTNAFWVRKAGEDTPTQVTATLMAASPNLYLWAEDGLFFNEENMAGVAQQLENTFRILRLRSNYGDLTVIPEFGPTNQDPTNLFELPDVDNDQHLFILYAQDLGTAAVIYNFNDGLPAQLVPGGYSNQHEIITVNTSVLPETPLDNGAYLALLTQGLYEFIAQTHTPDQDQWLREAAGGLLGRILEVPDLWQNATTSFLQNPNTSLNQPVSSGGTPVYGGQQLFMDYLLQRFGFALVQNLFTQSGVGLAPLDATLAEAEIIDPLTGKPLTAVDLFADFVVTNATSTIFSSPFGDVRFLHQRATLPEDTIPVGTPIDSRLNTTLSEQVVNQFGTRYYYLFREEAANFTFNFDGQSTTKRLNLPATSDDDNHFYWSGSGQNQNRMLTRSFDLSAVENATLTFDTWYTLSPARNYAYVEVSTDEGVTWDLLESDLSTTTNPNGLAYGPAYTGFSNPEGPRPFPFLGILIDNDGVTVSEVTPGGPAITSNLQAGDRMIGRDERLWDGPPNIVSMLANYEAGDTLNLYVERGGERLTIPIVLGEHPSRVFQPDPIWVPQTFDLSAYTGDSVLVRFEYISQPNQVDSGIALDNIAIAEIDYMDDAETANDWDLHGWQQVNNQVEQPFLVQYISSGTQNQPPRVRRLIGPDNPVTSGEWQFKIGPNELAIFAISGLNVDTTLPAQFDLTFSAGV